MAGAPVIEARLAVLADFWTVGEGDDEEVEGL